MCKCIHTYSCATLLWKYACHFVLATAVQQLLSRMSLCTLSSRRIRLLFLFVGVLSALVIIKCVNLNLLDNRYRIKSLDNKVVQRNTSGPIHTASQPPNLEPKSKGPTRINPASEPPNLSPKSKGQTGYVVPLGYGGHQVRGATGIASLQCLIKSFDLPMHIVEPLVSASQFLGLPKGKWVRFTEIFDINLFNKLTQVEDRFAQLVTWDDFLQNAPRNVIFLKLNASTQSLAKVEWEAQEQQIDTNHRDCKHIATLNYLQDRGFCVVKVVNSAYQHNHPFIADDLYKVIFSNWRPEEVTLIINAWTPNYLVPNPKLKNPLLCRKTYDQKSHQIFLPSKQILGAVQKYEDMFLKPSTSIAVMVRSEHFLLSLGYLQTNKTMLNQTITATLNKLVAITRKLQAKFPHGKVVVTADIGKYGSYTWSNTMSRLGNRDRELTSFVLNAVKGTVTALYDNSWTFEEWEESFGTATGGIEDQSYISVLQKSIAGRARCLILFGGGGFELIALNEYLRNHPIPSEQCWKFLGVRTNFKAGHPQLFANYSGIQIDDLD